MDGDITEVGVMKNKELATIVNIIIWKVRSHEGI